jgi:hypothetical protein
MVIHTFGEYLADFHPHLHALVADGLFDPQGGFHPLPEEIVLWPLEEMFRHRVMVFLVANQAAKAAAKGKETFMFVLSVQHVWNISS